ncbi:MAG: radical SAM family heme chaperone HemW [Candidatus Peregrinibacteria bacterium]|nr:radical SAM family heme chaperone HemW [Candidatus Peregrinibacteria bacterium]
MKDLSLYIHIPFCKTICLYCNFLTFANKQKKIPEYVDALVREIRERSSKYRDREIQTIYFGGGTPSLINPELIKKVIQEVKKYFDVKKDCEITIECNPESVDSERVRTWRDAGVTRFSLGVQSLNKKTLWRIARPHDAKMIFRALEVFKKSRVKHFGVDFIMGLPGQTLNSFKEEVETILTYKPTHASFYFLSYDTKKIDLFAKECPGEEEQIAMYEWLCGRLKRAGFSHYEVSNWALKGEECEHNRRYWEQKDYLGLGLGSHSIVDGKMWEDGSDFDAYLKDPLLVANEMHIDQDLKRMEYIMLRLRTNKGISLREYGKMGDVNKLSARAEEFIVSGHLRKIGNSLKATEKGFLLLEMITKKLI